MGLEEKGSKTIEFFCKIWCDRVFYAGQMNVTLTKYCIYAQKLMRYPSGPSSWRLPGPPEPLQPRAVWGTNKQTKILTIKTHGTYLKLYTPRFHIEWWLWSPANSHLVPVLAFQHVCDCFGIIVTATILGIIFHAKTIDAKS